MTNLVRVENTDLSVKEYRGQRVVTFKDIDLVHERADGTARATFNRIKERFVEGEDYFVCDVYEAKERYGISAPNGLTFVTEQGYLMLVKPFTDDLSWKVQRQLVNAYFKVRNIATDDLSPNLQLMKSLVAEMERKELADKERDRKIAETQAIAQKSIESVEAIKEAVTPILDDWRAEINKRIRRVQKMSNIDFQTLNNQMYSVLEHRAGCDLSTRLRNKRTRMQNDGRTKTDINNTRKIDIIEEDKKLREIFAGIVKEYEVKYCA